MELVNSLDDIKDDVLDVEMTRKLYRVLSIIDKNILQAELGRIKKYRVNKGKCVKYIYLTSPKYILTHRNKYES